MSKMIFLDLHLHSKWSLASSKNGDIKHFSEMAKIKGIDIVGTGDILHCKMLEEGVQLLKEDYDGIYSYNGVKFILSCEVSLIYKDQMKTKKVHLLILFPKLENVFESRKLLKEFSKIDSDGRPIIKMQIYEFVERMKNISDDIMIIPAHIWTPHFGLMGSKSGYDSVPKSIAKCFSAMETGLSSVPSMSYQLEELRKYTFVSFSDAHSPDVMGRESTISALEIDSFKKMKKMFERGEIFGTLEFYPEEGKYFESGHRSCEFSTAEDISICDKCGKTLVEGVFNRINRLSKNNDFNYEKKVFYTLPFSVYVKAYKILSENKITLGDAAELIRGKMPEMHMKTFADERELTSVFGERFSKFVSDVKNKKINIKSGYDGIFGEVSLKEVL